MPAISSRTAARTPNTTRTTQKITVVPRAARPAAARTAMAWMPSWAEFPASRPSAPPGLAALLGEVARHGAQRTDRQGGAGRHVAGRRGDADESHDGARGGAHRGDLAAAQPVQGRPGDQCRGSGAVGVDEGEHGDAVGSERRSGVEPEPPEPQDPRPEQHERDVVGDERGAPESSPGPEQPRRHQGRHARADVHHGPAGEIERAEFLEPAARTPDPVGERDVHQGGPQREERDVGAEPHPLDDRTRDQGGGDDGEHRLEHRVRLLRNRRRVGRVRVEPDAGESEPGQAAEPGVARSKGQGVAEQDPLDADDAERHDAHHHRVERVLGADQAAVEQRQADGHEEHEGARSEDPRGIAARDLRDLAHGSPAWASMAARWTSSALTAVSAALSASPVRIRITRSSAWTKILPSPTSPVRAEERMAWMVGSTNGSDTAISIFTFSWNSATTVLPRYCSITSRSPPWPVTRLSVIPVTPARNSAAFTSGSRSGRTIVVMRRIAVSPCENVAQRRRPLRLRERARESGVRGHDQPASTGSNSSGMGAGDPASCGCWYTNVFPA